MPNYLADRVKQVKPSPTLAIAAEVRKLIENNIAIINLGVGEPDFHTPELVKQAAIQAINENFTKYTAVQGILPLREAIVKKIHSQLKLNYSSDEILVSCGAKHSLFNGLMALLNPEDEVLIPSPYWVSYPDMVQITGAKPIYMQTKAEERFKITAKQLQSAITPQTKLLIFNSPSNPSGMVYSEQELKELAKVLILHPKILIMSDDIYDAITWSANAFHNLVSVCPELQNRALIVNGVSKTYAMTGWRIGYAAGPKPLIAAMSNIQSQSTSAACSIAQKAALAALTSDTDIAQQMVSSYKIRHDYSVAALNKIKGFSCQANDGTFYLFCNVSMAISNLSLNNDIEFCAALLKETQIAMVPGSVFGLPGYCRLSYAVGQDQLELAVDRLGQYLGLKA